MVMIEVKLSKLLMNAKTKDNLHEIVELLRIHCANYKSHHLIEYIEKAINLTHLLFDDLSLVNLYELKIKQLIHKNSNLTEVKEILQNMFLVAETINYKHGLALAFQIKSHIEHIENKRQSSLLSIRKSLYLLQNDEDFNTYTYNICNYSFAVGEWLDKHNPNVAKSLEGCAKYFYEGGFYRSFAQSLGILTIIYTRNHENSKVLSLSNSILANRTLFANLPLDVKGIVYYFTGLGYMLDANIVIAEYYFNEAYNILKPIYKDSIYFSNFLILHSYLATVKGLQGKISQADTLTKEAEILFQTDYIKSNLDENTRKQIVHTFNLVKFYNISRLSSYNCQEHQELINEIIKGCKDLYSDFMTFSEFILNSNLDSDKLQRLMTIDNFSINRIKHLIEFMLEKQKLETKISQEQKALNCISILEKRVTTSKTTFIEYAYRDLLIAQQLFSLKRYAEISPLLKQYESRLKQIEVLEMRIFMEAFIQVGTYKNGDPLGPALQYMAIKKCRLYGFSRLEYTLLNYLQLQQKEITRTI
ncbi:MAG: hypothetical protein ACTSQC_11140 [Candidatus Heimdallarchaeaceae archaeon]